MKISELVEELETIMKEKGDLEVLTDEGYDSKYGLWSVYFYDSGYGPYVVISSYDP